MTNRYVICFSVLKGHLTNKAVRCIYNEIATTT